MSAPPNPAEKGPADGSGGERGSPGEGHNKWLVAVVVSMATFMEVLDTSIANVSLPHIAGNLSASYEESTWVLTSYLVSNAIILPMSGWLATVIGRKRFYLICIALFGVSSLLCGLAPSLGWLVVCRVFQGLGGGGLAPSEQSILADVFPPQQRGQAFALYGVAVVVAPTLGPTLGGWITDNYSWHWIFFINVPVCLLSLFLSNMLLAPDSAGRRAGAKKPSGKRGVDYLGILLLAVGLGCLQVVLDRGQLDDWFSSDFILVFTLISMMGLVFLALWEMACEEPIIDLSLLKNSSFVISLGAMFVTGFVLLSTTQLVPQFLQSVENYNATQAGLALTAGGLATLLCMPMVGALLKKVQPKILIGCGLVIEGLACFHLAGFNTDVSFSHTAWARVYQGIGLPFLFVPISTLSYAGLPRDKSNNAAALINSMRNLGASFGISFGATALARRGQFHHGRLVETLTPFAQAHHRYAIPSPAALDRLVQTQAQMLSYIDIFALLGALTLAAVPLTIFLRRIKLGGEAAGH